MRLTRSERRALRRLARDLGTLGARLAPVRFWERRAVALCFAALAPYGAVTVLRETRSAPAPSPGAPLPLPNRSLRNR